MLTKVSKRLALISAKTIHERVMKAKVIILLSLYKKNKQEEKLIKQNADIYSKKKLQCKFLRKWVSARKKQTHDQQIITNFQEKLRKRKLLFIWNSWVRRTRRDFSSLNRKQILFFRKLERKSARKLLSVLRLYASKQIYLRNNLQHFTNYRLSFLCKRILETLLNYSQYKKQMKINSSEARTKYNLHLASNAFSSLVTYASHKKYYKQKTDQLDQLHSFHIIKTSYFLWRECFVEELLSRQANQTADLFNLALNRRKFIASLSKNVVDKNVTRELCLVGGLHFENRSKSQALKTLSIYSKVSLLRRYQNEVVRQFLIRKAWNYLHIGIENKKTYQARKIFATQLWQKSFKKKCFTKLNQLVQKLKMTKASGQITSLKRKQRTFKNTFQAWHFHTQQLKHLRVSVLSKINRDSQILRKISYARWKSFIRQVDMIAKADVYHSKVICSHLCYSMFTQWRKLYEIRQTQFRFDYISSSFWIEKTIKQHFQILKDHWQKKKSLHSKEAQLMYKSQKLKKSVTFEGIKWYSSDRKHSKSLNSRASVMYEKNMRTKVLAGLLIHLDLMARSHKTQGSHISSIKKKTFTQWKFKFLNRISHKQVLRGLFKNVMLNAKKIFFSKLSKIYQISDKIQKLEIIKNTQVIQDGLKSLKFHKVLTKHIEKCTKRKQNRIKENLLQILQENKEKDQSIRQLNQIKLQTYIVEKEDILMRLCINLWRRYTELKKLSAKSIGSYCLRLLKVAFFSLKKYKILKANYNAFLYQKNLISKRFYIQQWAQWCARSFKVKQLIAKVQKLRQRRSFNHLKEIYRESVEQDSLEPQTIIHSKCLLLKAMASIHRFYLKKLQFKIKYTKVQQNHEALLAREAFYSWILALKQKYELTKAKTIESHRLVKKALISWKRLIFERFKKRNFIKNLQVILDNRPVLGAPFLKLKHTALNKAWNSLKENVEIQKVEDVKNSKAIFLLYNKYLNKGFFALKANWADSQKNRLVHKMYEIKLKRKSMRKWQIYLMSRRRQTENNLRALSFAFQKYQRKAFFAFLLNSVHFKNEKLAAKKPKN